MIGKKKLFCIVLGWCALAHGPQEPSWLNWTWNKLAAWKSQKTVIEAEKAPSSASFIPHASALITEPSNPKDITSSIFQLFHTAFKNLINYEEFKDLPEEDLVLAILNDMQNIMTNSISDPKGAILTLLLIKGALVEMNALIKSISGETVSLMAPLHLAKYIKNAQLQVPKMEQIAHIIWQNQHSIILTILMMHESGSHIVKFWQHALTLFIKNPQLSLSLMAIMTSFTIETINYLNTAKVITQGGSASQADRLTFIANIFPKLLAITGISAYIKGSMTRFLATSPYAATATAIALVGAQLASIAYAYKATITILFLTRDLVGPFMGKFTTKSIQLLGSKAQDLVVQASKPVEAYIAKRYTSELANLDNLSEANIPSTVAEWALTARKDELKKALEGTSLSLDERYEARKEIKEIDEELENIAYKKGAAAFNAAF